MFLLDFLISGPRYKASELINYLIIYLNFSTWYVSFECLFHDVTYFKESKLHKMLNWNSITDLTPS